ncbi:MAG: VacJ family lipoprotein [Woeseiaceae bacterium]|nr:VacJ family lipoprotein [Woeseiaceae bacterium]
MNQCRLVALLCATCTLLGACASDGGSKDPKDPYENLNRKVYTVNDVVDRATLKPLARGYRAVLPRFARTGVSNFFDNLVTPRSAVNNVLQGKPYAGGEDLFRFIINSTVGIGGLIDVASAAGMPEHGETFQETFAVWGIPDGPYIVLPFLGPHTMSDVFALPFDIWAGPWYHYDNSSARDKLRVLRLVDIRYRILSADGLLEDSEDPYIALREAYLQNREFRIYDGDPPESQEDEDLFNEFFEDD